MTITQHDKRTYAFQTLFAMSSNPETNAQEVFAHLLDSQTDVENEVPADVKDLVEGVLTNRLAIDDLIGTHLKAGWSIARLNKADLAILRLAVYEMKYTETPAKIALNEALQLAKEFSDDRSRKFINAVLANFLA